MFISFMLCQNVNPIQFPGHVIFHVRIAKSAIFKIIISKDNGRQTELKKLIRLDYESIRSPF